jgi:enolase
MKRISSVHGREILDSRGNPTVEVDVILASGHMGRMMVPSGASTGQFEAWELRDGDASRYRGKGVRQAVNNVNGELAQAIVGLQAGEQELIDRIMIELDGTVNKSRLGANAILGVSLAVAHAAAAAVGKPLYRYLADKYSTDKDQLSIPLPMVNILSGGAHAGKNIELQDFLVIPVGAKSYPQALEMISSVYLQMKDVLNENGLTYALLADEGGFGPQFTSNKQPLDLLSKAIERAGFKLGDEMAIALDVASTQFYDAGKGIYHLRSENRSLTSKQMIDMLEDWTREYRIVSIEDGLAEEDWEGWSELTARLGHRLQLVGDDFFTTNPERIRRGIEFGSANAVLVKMNQIGTLTETVEAVRLARAAGWKTVISARSGETEDSTLADLAVGLQGGQIKIGSVARSSRLAKYNQLLRIDEQLGGAFAGRNVLIPQTRRES